MADNEKQMAALEELAAKLGYNIKKKPAPKKMMRGGAATKTAPKRMRGGGMAKMASKKKMMMRGGVVKKK